MKNNVERIESSASENSNLKIVNDDDSITPKIYQAIYHQITGRTEKISRTYDDNLLIDFDEIEELHNKILQIKDVHQILASNEIISIFYDNDRKEDFTSFERFRKYNATTTKPTINLILKYNFSILLHDIPNPQEYVVTVKLTSRLAAIEALNEKTPHFISRGLLAFFSSNVAEIHIEYADYVVARTFTESFDEWVSGCNSTPKNKLLTFFQTYSHYIPKLIKLIIALLCIYSYLTAIDLLPENFTRDWGRLFILSFTSFYVIIQVSFLFGRKIEIYIDSLYQDSYLNLNKGDKKLISNSKIKRNKIFKNIFLNACLTILLGIISSKLSIYF